MQDVVIQAVQADLHLPLPLELVAENTNTISGLNILIPHNEGLFVFLMPRRSLNLTLNIFHKLKHLLTSECFRLYTDQLP